MRGELDRIREQVGQVLSRYPAVAAAYLFGSRAKGEGGADSDIDLALLGARDALQAGKLDMLADLSAAGMERVDLVLLEGADTVLRFEAVHPNCLVYAREDFHHGSYFSRTIREYFDLVPYLEMQREALKTRLLDGSS